MEQVHLNGGFARAARFPADRLVTRIDDAEGLLASEDGAVAHMNADHADALSLYARTIAGKADGRWMATGIDPDGMDLALGDETARIPFDERVIDSHNLRKALVKLAHAALAAPTP